MCGTMSIDQPPDALDELPPRLDRRDFLHAFRDRLAGVIVKSGLSRAAFARQVGMDRSTLSQLLSAGNDRLPRVESLVAIASTQRVSLDWLLGLTEEGYLGADIVHEQTSIERDARSPTDERLVNWHQEAIGYKIRYVPATLPDLLKTESVIRYELDRYETTRPEQMIQTAAERLAIQRRQRPIWRLATRSNRSTVSRSARVSGTGWTGGSAPSSWRS